MTFDPPVSLDGRRAALAGAVAAGLALGLTELVAGITDRVPSAISSVGTYVVDYSPSFIERFAIDVFGTADKGALAIGTVLVGLVAGAIAGRLSCTRRWAGPAAFAAFAVLGIAAAFSQPSFEPIATVLTVAGGAGLGLVVLRRLMRTQAAGAVEPVAMPTDGRPDDPGRRRFMTGVAGAGATALVAGTVGRSMIISRSERVRSSIDLPSAAKRVDAPGAGASFAVDGLEPIVVPNDEFYRIDTALVVPRPDPETWQLSVTGMVDNGIELTMDDLLGMDLHERYVTISCVSNEVGGDLIGNALWTGVHLSEVLDMAGVQRGATQLVGRSVDGWTAGFPTDLVFDGREPLIAVGMNREPLPPDHGFPARLVVPGLYGYVSATKWLEEITLTTWEGFDGYWVPRGWSKTGPIKTQSRIDVPRRNELVNGKPAVLAGVAWAPLKGIERVEVRIDGGEWIPAELTTPLDDAAWVQWRAATEVSSGEHVAEVRATDGTGTTQTDVVRPPAPDGATGWHSVRFTAS